MKGGLAVLISAVLMGTLPYFVKNIELQPFSITFLRVFFGLIFVSLFMLVFREKPKISKKLFLLGAVNTGVVAFYISAISMLYAAFAALLLYMAPVYISAYKLLKGEISAISLSVTFLGVSGLFLMLYPFGEVNIGVIFGFLSGLFYAFLFAYLRRLRKDYSSLQITFSNLLVGAILLAPFSLNVRNFELIYVFLGLIPTAIPFVLLSYGMRFVKEERGAVIALIEPVVASFIGYSIFGEVLNLRQLIGAATILLASFVSTLDKEGEKDVAEG